MTSAYPGCPTDTGDLTMQGVRRWVQRVALTVNRINQGHSNVVLDVDLDANATTTTVTDDRITAQGAVLFDPTTAAAASELASGSMWVSARLNGSVTITHSGSFDDRTFRMVVLG